MFVMVGGASQATDGDVFSLKNGQLSASRSDISTHFIAHTTGCAYFFTLGDTNTDISEATLSQPETTYLTRIFG